MKRFCFLFMVILGLNFCSAQDIIYDTINKEKGKGTLWDLARKHKPEGCSAYAWIDSMKKWNNLSDNNVNEGDVLIVDKKKVQKGENNGYEDVAEEADNQTITELNDISVISSDSSNVILKVGSRVRLEPNTEGKSYSFEWESNKRKIVSVDTNGVITAHAKGKAMITAKPKKSSTKRVSTKRWEVTVVDEVDGHRKQSENHFLLKFLIYIVIFTFVVFIVARKRSSIAGLFSKQRTNTQNHTAGNNVFLDQISRLESEKKKLQEENIRLQRENAKLEQALSELKRKNNEYFEENISLGEQLDKLKGVNKVDDTNVQMNKDRGPSKHQTQFQDSTVLYADAIVDGNLVRVKENAGDDSIFELHLNNSNTAKIVICKNAVQRVIANPSFIDGCEKQILPNASKIEIVTPGVAKKESENGKWVVDKKLKVILN